MLTEAVNDASHTMLAIMLLKASEPALGVVVEGVVVDVVSDGVGAAVEVGIKGGGREPRPSLKTI